MKKVTKKATRQTLDNKKIDGVAKIVGTLSETVDSFARSTKEGFDRMDIFHAEMTDFKVDMADFVGKTNTTLFNMDSKLHTVDQRLDAIEKTLEPLMLASGAMQRELREHERRLVHVEQKVGLVNQ